MILVALEKLPKNVEDLGKLIVAKGFKKLPKVQKIAILVTLPSTSILLNVEVNALVTHLQHRCLYLCLIHHREI